MAKDKSRPPGVKGKSGLSPTAIKYGAYLVGIAVVIGVSHYLSPKEEAEEEDTYTPTSGAGKNMVLELNDTSFDSFLAANPEGALVNFHSQSCTFCAKLAPEFKKAAAQSKASGGPPFVSLDSASAPLQMKRFSIDRFPTVYWFWQGQNTLELQRAAEKPAEKIAAWASWAFTSQAVVEMEGRKELDESLPLMRQTLHPQHRMFVAFNHTGFEDLRAALEPVAQRNKANTVFLFVKDVTSEGPLIKALSKDESEDTELTSATTESLEAWVQKVVDEAKIKRLESQVEEKKAKNEPLEKTLDVLKAASEAKESAEAAEEAAAPA